MKAFLKAFGRAFLVLLVTVFVVALATGGGVLVFSAFFLDALTVSQVLGGLSRLVTGVVFLTVAFFVAIWLLAEVM